MSQPEQQLGETDRLVQTGKGGIAIPLWALVIIFGVIIGGLLLSVTSLLP